MRYLIATALLATALAVPLASASAAPVGPDVMAACNQSVGKMKFEGWPADRNREMMMSACQMNGGVIPGGQQESPVSLQRSRHR